MARCADDRCRRWRPDVMAIRGVAGLVFDGTWYCSPACLEAATRARLKAAQHGALASAPARAGVRLGSMLLHQRVLDPAGLGRALDEQRVAGGRLGEVVRRLALSTDDEIVCALAKQEGVSYLTTLDPTSLLAGPGDLSRGMVRVLGVVPFFADAARRLLHVACAAPVPRLAIAALHHLTGWTVEPFLVSDRLMPALLDAYGAARPDAERRSPVCDVPGAAERISRAAAGGATGMSHARSDAHVWVRITGRRGTEDLLLPVRTREEEAACRVAHTSH